MAIFGLGECIVGADCLAEHGMSKAYCDVSGEPIDNHCVASCASHLTLHDLFGTCVDCVDRDNCPAGNTCNVNHECVACSTLHCFNCDDGEIPGEGCDSKSGCAAWLPQSSGECQYDCGSGYFDYGLDGTDLKQCVQKYDNGEPTSGSCGSTTSVLVDAAV